MDAMAKRKPRADKKPPDAEHSLVLRMTEKVFGDIQDDADKHFRSVNMHILWLIEQHLSQSRRPTAD